MTDRPRRPREPDVAEVLKGVRTIAVLGAHPRREKPAHFVPDYMARHGYRILPVNPVFVDRELWGETPVGSLVDLDVPVDLVVVFRRSENVPDHLGDILAMEPRPKVVWMQQGIRHEATAARLRADGIEVVQDACLMVEHRRAIPRPT